MNLTDRQKWTSMTLLSILVPMCLLSAFRLGGILREPIAPETITVEAATWNMSRPTNLTKIGATLRNFYNDSIMSANFTVLIAKYEDSYAYPWTPDSQGIRFDSTVVINVTRGFVHSIFIRFSQIDDKAILDVMDDDDFIELHNVWLRAIKDWQTESYVEAYGVNNPKDCNLTVVIYWFFFDAKNIVNHSMTVNLEATYFNGTAYRKVIVPIKLEVLIP